MVKHIVMWHLKNEANGNEMEQNAAEMIQKLRGLKEKIPQIVELEAGRNINQGSGAFDVALYSSFKSKDDLEAYAKNPEHLKVVEFIKSVVDQRAVVDYEV